MFIHIKDGAPKQSAVNPPDKGVKEDGSTVSAIAPDNLLALASIGWHPLTDTERPPDTNRITYDRVIDKVNGNWAVVWVARELSPEDTAARDTAEIRETNRRSIADKVESALSRNADYLSLTAPTNGEVLAQVRSLTQQNQRVIRYMFEILDSDS